MRIDFEREGGYAPIRLEYHADTDELPVDVRDRLLGLIKSSGVMQIQQSDLSTQPFPDAFKYTLRLSEGGRSKSLTFSDATVPSSLHPLLELFQELALEQRSKR
jgi:hypothetical protein